MYPSYGNSFLSADKTASPCSSSHHKSQEAAPASLGCACRQRTHTLAFPPRSQR